MSITSHRWEWYYWANLNEWNAEKKSDPDSNYNCVAFAVGDESRRWWPTNDEGYYWPPGYPREETEENFLDTLRGELGYELCESGSLEEGFEKISIYVKEKDVTHISKQLSDGRWKSKMGELEDIHHTSPETLNGRGYGRVKLFLKRKINEQ